MRHLHQAVAAAVVITGTLFCDTASAGVRAFVSSTGNDANTASQCGPTTPCRGFTAAMSVVDPNGEIIALDAAGYGAVTVTKSVSIIANPGFYAGVAASSGVAITIATASVNVVLRGLNINNIGTATTGINMTNGSRLVIDNCTISNFTNNGVNVTVAAEVRILNSTIRDNSSGVSLNNGATAAIAGSKFAGHVQPGLAAIVLSSDTVSVTTTAMVSDSVFSGNYVGIYACTGTGDGHIAVSRSSLVNNTWGVANDSCGILTVVVSNNLITGNGTGLANFGGATYFTLGNNTGGMNGSNTTGTMTGATGF